MLTGLVKIAQVDDYISPSQNCVESKIIKEDSQSKAVVSLSDCLACSGCITSAESILIDQMSIKKFQALAAEKQSLRLILSPQSILSLAHHYGLSPSKTLKLVTHKLKEQYKNIDDVCDLREGIHICHSLLFQQFENHLKKKQTLFCSECPGWVCYAQKTLGESVTEMMSQVKSPQQVLARMIRVKHPDACIISIMPCYDKKIQAIRFTFQQGQKQLDLSLTTKQLLEILNVGGITKQILLKVQQQPEQADENMFVRDQVSNGYLWEIMRRLNIQKYEEKEIRNKDLVEFSFQYDGGNMKLAKCYGFRNIQKIVQQVKKKTCQYSFVEIMACPGGCFNGGGQISHPQLKPREIADQMKLLAKQYSQKPEQMSLGHLYSTGIQPRHLKNKYKPIKKSVTQAVMNW